MPSGTPLLDFHYQTSSGEKIFELPKAVAVNRSSNQLTYTYTKDNKNLSIDFQGTLMIGGDFEITYVVQRQVSSGGDEMVASTTLTFSATLTQPNLHGDLQLTLTKPDGTAGTSTLHHRRPMPGRARQDQLAGRLYVHPDLRRRGKPDHQNRGVQRNASVFNGGQVQWTFSATGGAIDLAIGVDIKLGPIQLDARLNLPVDGGQTAGVTFLLGVSF